MADMLSGENAKIDVDGLPYAVRRFSVRRTRPRRDVSNTEGKAGNPAVAVLAPGYESAKPGLRKAELTLEDPSFDTEANPFSLPFALASTDYCDVKVYPNGRGGDYHWFPSIQLEEIGHDGTAGEEQPVTLRGGSDGVFFLYGEAKP
jgi:hypothetical protein